ncbi:MULTISPECIES: hypothetical protein [Streptosporangium]|uniref:DUF4878 domain-containing protein n=1 Tax=Streptosporangium brasiliense TaxID=47480 RepID=A0ABT9R552_9ACTN|nr:hypothetical protein [Streptosporangium brasiliense]MDP9864278.1 hypothetical protein [Streptosporangium brasiliense]
MGYPPEYGQPPRGETGRGLAVIVMMIVGVLIATVVSMMAVLDPAPAPKSPSVTRGPEHSESAVRQAAQVGLDAYSSGSYDDFWDLWSTQAQAAITREEYVRLFQLCPQPVSDVRFTLTTVTVTGDNATVQATRLSETTDFDFLFESGSWRYVPTPEDLQEYQTKGTDQLAQERRAAGVCGAAVPTTAPDPSNPGVSTPAPSDPGVPTSVPSSAPSSAPSDPAASVPGPTASSPVTPPG